MFIAAVTGICACSTQMSPHKQVISVTRAAEIYSLKLFLIVYSYSIFSNL